MRQHPRPQGRLCTALLTTALGLGVAAAGAGCDNTAAQSATQLDEANGALRGLVNRYIADRDDGTSETLFGLRLPDGTERRLLFDGDPGLTTDTPVSIWGDAAGTALRVTRFRVEPAGTIETQQSALVGADAAAPRKFAFVLVDTGGGVNLTATQATQQLFDPTFFMPNQGSIRRYYQEESYAIQDIDGAVVGPIAYTPTSTCDTMGVTSLRTMVDTMLGGPSNHYLWYFGSKQSGCSFAGLASEGSPTRPQRDTWYNASSGCVVLVQEPGHNFGMQHSSSMACPGGVSFVDAPDGVCTHNEYGDSFDPMGSGCRHMNGWQKAFEGWLAGCNSVKVTSSGTFTLFPLETACNGIQMLQVPMPKTRTFSHSGGGGNPTTDTLTSYYVELRTSVGFDQGLTPEVLIHVAGDYPVRTRSGLHTWLLDMTPNTTSVRDAALPVGSTFNDPAGGVSITVMAASATSASIQVTITGGTAGAAPTCLDGTTVEAPGPQTCGAPADGGTTTTTTGGGGAGGGSGGAGGAGPGSGGAGGGRVSDASTGGGIDAGIINGMVGKGATSDVTGGCACATAARSSGSRGGLWAALALGAVAFMRRRRRRR